MTKKLILLIFLVGFVVYTNSLFNNFVWDDEEQIVKNSTIQNFSNLPLIFTSSTFYGGGAPPTGWFYRPVMSLSYMINYSVWGSNPFGFHLFQVLLHLINASLVFLIFAGVFEKEKIPKASLAAFFAGLTFAIHPANVEAVAYIAALQENLFTFFGLAVLFFLTKDYPKKPILIFSATSFFLLLSLLSKESAIAIIPIVFVYLFFFKKEKVLPWFASSFLSFLFYLLARLGIARIPLSHPTISPIVDATSTQRFLTIPYEIFSYLRLALFPKTLMISQHVVIKEMSDFRFWGLLTISLSFFGFLVWFWLKTRSKLFLFFSFWFIFSLGLVLNIIPLDMTVAERWLYFPMIGFLGMMSLILVKVVKSWPKISSFLTYLLIIILVLLAIRTIARNSNWRNGLTLFEHDIAQNREAFDLENNYGVELFRVGRLEEAKIHFERSITLMPKWWFPYNNLGAAYQRLGDFKKAKIFYQESLKRSDYYLAYENLGRLMLKTDKPQDSIQFLTSALEKFPQNGNLWASLALAYYQKQEFTEAEKFAQKAVTLAPTEFNKLILITIIQRKPIEY